MLARSPHADPEGVPSLLPPPPSRQATSSRRRLVVLVLTLGLVLAWVGLARLAPDSVLGMYVTAVMVVWLLAVGIAGAAWLWRRLTYRVGIRLFLSYLIIGVLPFLLLGTLGASLAAMAVGQYTSVRFGTLLNRTYESAAALVAAALDRPPLEVTAFLAASTASPPEGLIQMEWAVEKDGQLHASPGLAAAGSPAPLLRGDWSGPLVLDGRTYLAVARQRAGRLVVVMVPLALATRAAAGQASWFEASIAEKATFTEAGNAAGSSLRVEGNEGRTAPIQEPLPPLPGAPLAEDDETTDSIKLTGLLARRFVVWPRISKAPLDWQTGAALPEQRIVVVLRTSPAEAWRDFMRAPYRLAAEVQGAFVGLTVFFSLLYALVVSFAVGMVVAIARAASRLTRGARAVAGGDLTYRIPVPRRDQLGDLAVAFNGMTEAVARMLVEVAEKERLRREMELAREIQQSLLPATQLQHGGVGVSAHFLPASEVGGDYFDVFPLPGRHLLVTVGDVAGHGVSTGLLMAMMKSAMGTLVLEGYSGVKLLERLNRLLLQQSVKHRMATLVLAEVDAAAGQLQVTSCGHPPALLVTPDGRVEELLLSSLPLGTRLPIGPAWRRLAFPPGSKLVLYSDGLIEAANRDGEALGGAALVTLVEAGAALPVADLVAAVLTGVEAHLAGTPLADDLTVLVVENGVGMPSARG